MSDILKRGKVEVMDITFLKPYENNAKKHPPEQVAKIAASIRENGWRDAHAIEITADGTIINGHGRWMAAQSLDMKTVKVQIVDDMSPEQIRKYRMDDNQVSVSEFDTDLMVKEINELLAAGLDLSGTFDQRDLDFASVDLGDFDLDAITKDLAAQVDEHSQSTANKIEELKDKNVPISKALGFSIVTGEQHRTLTLLMAHVEALTGLEKAAALTAWAGQQFTVESGANALTEGTQQ